jgi:hypothetical protein
MWQKLELIRQFTSPIDIIDVKTSRLRFDGHLRGRPEDLLQKAIFSARLPRNEVAKKTKIQVSRWDE